MIDPYATLGLPRGASLDEVKRAYRALAKRYHPDSAGDAATKRFLAVQAAYEMLTDPGRGPQRSGGAGPAANGAPARTSSADSARARATREAYRTRRSWTSTGGAPGSTTDSEAGTARGSTAGPTTDAAAGSRSASGGGAGRGADPARGRDADSERRRAQRKASLGSTSYDDALDWEPEWTGGTWYGASSGTHWTVNPREYADPRKHGPEYLARARRRVEQASARDRGEGARPTDEDVPDLTRGAADAAETAPPTRAPRSSQPDSAPGWTSPSSAQPRAHRVVFENVDPPRPGGRVAAVALDRGGPSIPARLVTALIAWPPLGYLLALVVGEATGCARYAAGCSDGAWIAMWGIQPLVLALLLLVPAIARPAAVGAIALLAAAVPAAAAFSASAGNRGPTRDTVTLFLAIVVLAYAVGAVGAALDRIPLPRWLRPGDAGD